MDPNIVTGTGYLQIIKSILDLGPIGLVLILGFFAQREIEKKTTKYESQITVILAQYQKDMLEQRKMYEDNVELVKQYQSLAGDLKDIIVMNTTALTRLVEKIEKEVCK